jgi:hypothetical protein
MRPENRRWRVYRTGQVGRRAVVEAAFEGTIDGVLSLVPEEYPGQRERLRNLMRERHNARRGAVIEGGSFLLVCVA